MPAWVAYPRQRNEAAILDCQLLRLWAERWATTQGERTIRTKARKIPISCIKWPELSEHFDTNGEVFVDGQDYAQWSSPGKSFRNFICTKRG